MKNKLKKALLEKRLSVGTWMQIGHPAVAEVLAGAGFDWICVDMEHGHIHTESMTNIFRTLAAFEVVPVVRVPKNDDTWIAHALDAGARGLIVPMVNTPDEAERAVRCARYPPDGSRGFGYARANAYGQDFDRYAEEANEDLAIIAQIEHREGIDHLEDILEVEGIDGYFIGPYDLSGSYGKPGSLEDPQVQAALTRFLRICAKKDKAAGLHIVRPGKGNVSAAIDRGYTFMALGLDVQYLAQTAGKVLSCVPGSTDE